MKEYLLEEKQLRLAVIPPQTSTYKPVQHGTIIDLTRDEINNSGFSIVNETYRGTQNCNVATGFYDRVYNNDSELGIRIAWQNSYDKTVSLKYVIGTCVFVCSNGMFFGNMGAYKKKHIGEIQTLTPSVIQEYIGQAGEVYAEMVDVRDKMKAIPMSRADMATTAGLLFFNYEILPASVLTRLREEFNKPSCIYSSPDTLWEFYNFCTYVLRNTHPRQYFSTHQNLHNAIEELYLLNS